ncbi:ABC transporter permease [Taibaiella soli]|uniref:Transport permease protein n=2 Tax=Taibaiella soli TaxID=1649169 RepID=A0A2W2AER5_9BACT|nr:ABC transporter permease [Taibaiella soli]
MTSPTKGIQNEHWTEIIEPKTSVFDLKLKDVWRYRDLLMLLVRRDFVATYKQTILGPIWFFLQPILTTITYVIIFANIAQISTDGLPPVLFYLAGTTMWNYFSECLNRTATVFKDNAAVFGKVYFPRLVMPLSIVLSNLVKLGIQMILFIAFWIFYLTKSGSNIHPNSTIALLPALILLMGGLGLGFGMIISALTTKYRDLVFLLTFGIQLLMYATPVIYPLSKIGPKYKWLILSNPMTSIIETFRYSFLGSGTFSWAYLGYSAAFTLVVLAFGTVIFNKVEKSFMDTV